MEKKPTSRRKALYVASIGVHFSGFHGPYLQLLQDEFGYETYTASNGESGLSCVNGHFEVPFSREPLTRTNLAAYSDLKKVISENHFDLIHCHTPAAAVLTRIAAKKTRKKGTKVVYTAHGFHFFEGNSRTKNFIFRNIERLLSKHTDVLITINREDYDALSKYKFRQKKKYYTAGVGVDSKKFHPVESKEEKLAIRKELEIPENAFVLFYPAGYEERKQHRVLIQAVAQIKEKCPRIYLLLPGGGALESELKSLVRELNMEKDVNLPGRRTDVERLAQASDIIASTSYQEGLPTHTIEGMCTGLPVVASRIRGQTDLIEDGVNGFLFPARDENALAEKIELLYNSPELVEKMGRSGFEKSKKYHIKNTVEEMKKIYEQVLELKESGYAGSKS